MMCAWMAIGLWSLKTICASWSFRIKQAARRILIYMLGRTWEKAICRCWSGEASVLGEETKLKPPPRYWTARAAPFYQYQKDQFHSSRRFSEKFSKKSLSAWHFIDSWAYLVERKYPWLGVWTTIGHQPHQSKFNFLKIFWYFRISIWQYLDPLPLSGKILDQCSLDQSPSPRYKVRAGGTLNLRRPRSLWQRWSY